MDYKIGWDDLKEAAKIVFSVRIDQPELQWAKDAWGILDKHKLNAYTDEFERHEVIFRFLVLGGSYHDFCNVAWQEYSYYEYSDWAESFDLNPFIIGQLFGCLEDWIPSEDKTDALDCLVENQRSLHMF